MSLKVTELEPHRAALRRLWRDNPTSSLWEVIQARWGRCVDHASGILNRRSSGEAGYVHEARAAEEVLKLQRNVPLQELACTAMAIYVFQADRPYRFTDDQSFLFQLVRRVRSLSDLAVYTSWNHKRRTTRKVYRDLPPATVRVLAGFLGAAFGEAGLLLRDHEKARPDLKALERQRMAEAVKALA